MAKRQFDETGHPCEAIDLGVGGDAWFYTQKEGLIICANGCPHCGRQRNSMLIPWRVVKRAIADHEKAKVRRGVVGSPKQS